MIDERLEKRKAEAASADGGANNLDLLDILMEELYSGGFRNGSDEHRRIIEDIIGHCKLFFFAGYETSSNLLCWIMILLSHHQNWQDRARQEVRHVLGTKDRITADDLSKLKLVCFN